VLFEDEHLLAVLKPAYVAAQATLATDRGALTSLVAEYLDLRSDREVGLVHRLDRETSGVTVFGKTALAVRSLAEAFRVGTVRKRYLAVAGGSIAAPLEVDAWLAKDPSRPGQFKPAPAGTGVPAETRVEPLSPPGLATLVACWPRTGRTHQIRVHLLSLNAPIVGDARYGGPTTVTVPGGELRAERVLLHAERLELTHPKTRAPLVIHAPVPEDLAAAMRLLGVDPEA
jgi:23S rRNA pseudouridine1911/1915/1917 synthase